MLTVMVLHNSSKNEESYKFFKRDLQSNSAQFVEDRVGVHEETFTAVFCFAGA